MELLDILQAFKKGKEVQYRAHGDQKWQSVCCNHKWNTEKFEYRIKPGYEIFPYNTREEIFEQIATYGSSVMNKHTGKRYYIADLFDALSGHVIKLKKNIEGSCYDYDLVSYQDFADDFIWWDSSNPCGWDSKIYKIVEEPIYDRGVQWGVERRVVKKGLVSQTN